ncbi:MAG TPA: cytochrome P450 [Ilumatobacteraceae bacterium]|nr:cytochrome P450 [Ilumatobacteraceae bacterium]
MTGPPPPVDGIFDLGPADADIVDPDTYTAGVPHATFLRLRRDDPVSWWDEPDGHGFWAVTRHADLLHVSRNVETFSSAQGVTLEEMDPGDFLARRNMLEYDPPEHTRYRRLVSKPFSRREVYAYEGAIRLLARSVLDEAMPQRAVARFDFVETVAKQLPMRMLGRLLGVPDTDGPWLVERGDALLGNFDPDFTDHPVGLTDTDEFRAVPFRSPAALDLYRYAELQAAARRANPTDDVITDLLAPTIDGDRLTDREFKNFFVLLVGAGNDTTRYTITAGIKALIERPDQLDELRGAIVGGDDGLVDSAVEEILRWGTVTMHFRRTATRDAEVGGRPIRAGDKVVMWFVSADYDDAAFADPFVFDIHRSPNPQVAFGLMSPHLCLGAQLARMEIKILFQELLPRLADARITGPIERMRSNFIAGVKRLPVELALA